MPLAPLSAGKHLHGDSASPGGGRFVIEKPLSAGGFAITYLARDQQLDDRCVIKELAIDQLMLRSGTEMVPLPGREADVAVWVQKVQKEAQTLHRLRSAGVVPIRATWRELGTAYFAMDFVDGIELPAEPTAGADWATWEPVARKFLAALGAIHAAGLVHGDIKPQNVLVNREGNPVIIDFGTARSTEEAKKTKLTTLAMTPGYCPPELAVRDRAKEMGPWSDLYSWALTVMGLVIRHGGIDGAPLDTSARMALAKHGHSDAGIGDESASALRAAGLPEGWVQALMACVALEPSARPQSAEEVAARIDAAPVKAKPATAGATTAPASSNTSDSVKLNSLVTKTWRRLFEPSSIQLPASRKVLFVTVGLGLLLGLGSLLAIGTSMLGFQEVRGPAADTSKSANETTDRSEPPSHVALRDKPVPSNVSREDPAAGVAELEAIGGVSDTGLGQSYGQDGLGKFGGGLSGGGGRLATGVGGGPIGVGRSGGSNAGGNLRSVSDRKARTPVVSSQPFSLTGALDMDIVRRVVAEHRREIIACYETELQKLPELQGRIDVDFVIGSDGAVGGTKLKASTLNNATVEFCVQRRVRQWRFPEPKGGGTVRVSYPWIFTSGG